MNAPTAHAPRSTVITARFAGTCACGAKVQAGASIAYSRRYDWPIVGCAACDFGTFPGATPEALLELARSAMSLADNGIKIRARNGSVGRLLTLNTLAADARRALLAAA